MGSTYRGTTLVVNDEEREKEMNDATAFVFLLITILNGDHAQAQRQDNWRDYSPDGNRPPITREYAKPDRAKKEHKIRKTPVLDPSGNNIRIITDEQDMKPLVIDRD
jgi:hypothetical protein